jgi:hypothetical protein
MLDVIMRCWGLMLLLAGFALLLGIGFLSDCTDADIFTNAYDSLPYQQRTFSREEVQKRLENLFNGLHFHHPGGLIIPSFMMLAGGLILYKRSRNSPTPPNI